MWGRPGLRRERAIRHSLAVRCRYQAGAALFWTGPCGNVRFCTASLLHELTGPMTDQTLSVEENDAVADMVREALARRRITRQYLADQAKISLSTLEKALSGQRPFTLASIVR